MSIKESILLMITIFWMGSYLKCQEIELIYDGRGEVMDCFLNALSKNENQVLCPEGSIAGLEVFKKDSKISIYTIEGRYLVLGHSDIGGVEWIQYLDSNGRTSENDTSYFFFEDGTVRSKHWRHPEFECQTLGFEILKDGSRIEYIIDSLGRLITKDYYPSGSISGFSFLEPCRGIIDTSINYYDRNEGGGVFTHHGTGEGILEMMMYYPSGKVKMRKHFVWSPGFWAGPAIEYYENGTVARSYGYYAWDDAQDVDSESKTTNSKHGDWKWFDQKGGLTRWEVWEKGTLVKVKVDSGSLK